MAKSSTSFKKGENGNPGGMPAKVAQAVRDLRAALEGDADEVHAALMRLVRADNPQAIIYAHTQLIGKPKDRVEVSGDAAAQAWLGKLTAAQVLAIARGDVPKEGDE
jgi:hypothetical protein